VGGSRTRRAGDARGRARAAPPRAREGDDGRLPSTHTLPSIELSGASATVEAPLPPPSTAVAGEWRRRRPARPMARLMVRRMGVCVGGWGAAASEAAGQSAATVRSEGGAARAAAALAACPGATTRSASVGRPSPSRRRRRRLSMTTDYGAPPARTPAAASLPNETLPCAFWDADVGPESEHPDALAIQALKDECTPDERAETYKV